MDLNLDDRKCYVIDTSVILADPAVLTALDEHIRVLPLVVLKELEKHRSHPTLGFNARAALRTLEDLRLQPHADLRHGVVVNSAGGVLRIEINHVDASGLPAAIREDASNDTRLLSVAHALAQHNPYDTDGVTEPVIVLTRDLPLRLLASTLGIRAEEYRRDQAVDFTYTGMITVDTSTVDIDALYKTGILPATDIEGWPATPPPVNTGVVLRCGSASALGMVTPHGQVELVNGDAQAFGVKGRSAEQRVALRHLLNNATTVVSIGGRAGTGKTVLALAAALESVLEQGSHRRIVVFRPVVAVGQQDLGFIPGTLEEKMAPWTGAITDALRAITTDTVIDEITARGLLEVLPLTHIRGRTFGPSDILLVDEVQNLSRADILAVLTRLGENSRAFLLGDIDQIDAPYVTKKDGIAMAVQRLLTANSSLFAHIELTRSERSPMAELASRLLN